MRKFVVDPVAGHVWEGGDPGEAQGDASDRNNPWPIATVCIIHGCDIPIVVGVSPHCVFHGAQRGHHGVAIKSGKGPVVLRLTKSQHVGFDTPAKLRPAFDGRYDPETGAQSGWVKGPTGAEVAEGWRDQTGDTAVSREPDGVLRAFVSGSVPVVRGGDIRR